jgi:tryptophan-rich sensory protein
MRSPFRWDALALWGILTFAAAAAGSWFTQSGMDGWYQSLAKPSWNPPQWLFGPAWTLLYFCMAIAAWRAQRFGGPAARPALTLFGAQLLLNAAWPGVFFGLGRFGAALLVLAALLAAVLALIPMFRRIDRLAGDLLIPYAAWLSFALALNVTYWRLNA